MAHSSLRLDPTNNGAMYQISLAYALSGDAAERAKPRSPCIVGHRDFLGWPSGCGSLSFPRRSRLLACRDGEHSSENRDG